MTLTVRGTDGTTYATRRRRSFGPFVAICTTCGWKATAGTWRPARRRLAIHVAKTHPDFLNGTWLPDNRTDVP